MLPRILANDFKVESRDKLRTKPGFRWVWSILYIIYSLEVGLFLLVLPWMGIWDNNYLLYRYPGIRLVTANPFFKGAVLGLGIVNIVIGIQEIAQLRNGFKYFISR